MKNGILHNGNDVTVMSFPNQSQLNFVTLLEIASQSNVSNLWSIFGKNEILVKL